MNSSRRVLVLAAGVLAFIGGVGWWSSSWAVANQSSPTDRGLYCLVMQDSYRHDLDYLDQSTSPRQLAERRNTLLVFAYSKRFVQQAPSAGVPLARVVRTGVMNAPLSADDRKRATKAFDSLKERSRHVC